MVAESELLVRLHRLRTELAVDVAALEARAEETRALAARWVDGSGLSRAELVLIAVNLHGWYTAFETALERVARLLDQTVPAGPSWHLDLVEQMRIDVPGLRSALVPTETLSGLHELRKFRHFFRNAYVLDLDPAKLLARAADLESIAAVTTTVLHRFLGEIVAAIDELSREG